MEITPRRLGRWTALPSWKRRRRSPGLFAPSVTISFQRSPKPSRPIRSSSTWTTARMIHRIFRHAAVRLPCRANWGSRRRNRNTKLMCLSPILRVCVAAIASLALAEALKSTGVDAEKKPAGFKELQISIRENVRRIDDLILSLPVDKRPFFREVRTDLVKTQNELIDALFPRRSEERRVGKECR